MTLGTKPNHNKQVFYMGIGDKFLRPNGTLKDNVMIDPPPLLHPNAASYQIGGESIIDKVKELMGTLPAATGRSTPEFWL
jgi:hypothetical protein